MMLVSDALIEVPASFSGQLSGQMAAFKAYLLWLQQYDIKASWPSNEVVPRCPTFQWHGEQGRFA